jgi:SAM-dependent methyltransferase
MDLTEDHIRPHRFDAGKEAALEADLAWLRERRSEFINVPCPACLRTRRAPAFEKFGFSFVSCLDCRTVYMAPRAPAHLLGEFYSRSVLYEFWNEFIFPASRGARKERLFRPRVQRIADLCARLGIATDLLIEVGAAHGMFCEEVKSAGIFNRVVAIEPGRALAETCRRVGIETFELPVERLMGVTAANVVASFETIEHLFSPRDFVTQCREILLEGGLLVMTCPNYEGFDIQTLGVMSESLDAEHINLFNPDSISRMLEECRFEVLELTTPGQLDAELVRTQILDGRFDISGREFLKLMLVDRWEEVGPAFQAFLRDNKLSSHMWVVARRL